MGILKQYVLDTNIFIYLTNRSSSDDLRRETRYFWKKAKKEFENGEAVLLVPKEVRRELEIQSYTLTEERNNRTNALLEHCREVSPTNLTQDVEHKIRQLTAYVRANFKEDIGRDKMEYGGVSDSRILYTAYIEDGILVTGNVKDFLLYPLLFPLEEQRIYSINENKFVVIPPDGYTKIHSDPDFQKLLKEFFKLSQQLEEIQ